MTLAANPDALAVGDTGGNIDVDRAVVQRAADAVAGRARRLDHASEAVAARARARAHELPEDALRDLLHPPCTSAHVTGDGRCARSGTVAATRLAGLSNPGGHADRDPGVCLRQADLGARDDIAATRRSAATGLLAEERLAEKGAEDIGEVAEVEVGRREATPAQALAAEAVVRCTTLGVGQHLVRLRRLAEALLGIGLLRDVGMELAGELAEGPLDGSVVGAAVDPENLVVVAFGRRHQVVEGTGTGGRDCAAQSSSYTSSTSRESSNAAARTARIALS